MDSVFINSIRNIRVSNSIVHFDLGEDRPINNNIESTIALKATMSEKDFLEMVGFLGDFIKKGHGRQKPNTIINAKDTPSNDKLDNKARKKVKISSSSDLHG